MNKYKLTKSSERPGWWVLADTVNNIVIQFEEHLYNETQKISVLDDLNVTENTAADMARVMREMGDYMVRHHIGIAMNVAYGLEYSEDDTELYLCRYKSPRWRMLIQEDEVDGMKLAVSLKKAAEFLTIRYTR